MVAKRAPMQHEEKVATRDRQCCINNIKIKIIEELLFDKRFPVMLEKLSSISCTNATYKCWPRKKKFFALANFVAIDFLWHIRLCRQLIGQLQRMKILVGWWWGPIQSRAWCWFYSVSLASCSRKLFQWRFHTIILIMTMTVYVYIRVTQAKHQRI